MRKIFISAIVFMVLLSCNRAEKCDLHNIYIDSDMTETLVYVGKIGNDYNSALDSLMILKEYDDSGMNIQRIPISLVFDCDNRQFWGIVFDFCGNYSDVLDSKGNYYNRSWTSR